MAGVIDGKNRLCACGNPCRNLFGIQVQRIFENVGEDRRRTLIKHTVRRGSESQRRSNRLIPWLQSGGKSRRVQGGRARTEADRIFCAYPGGHRFFELSDLGTCGQPVGAKRLHHGLNVSLIDRLSSVRQQSLSDGRSAEDRGHFTYWSHRHKFPFRLEPAAFLLVARRRPAETFRRRVHTAPRRSAIADCCRCYSGTHPEAAAPASSFPFATRDAPVGSRTCHPFRARGELRLPITALRAVSLPGVSRWLPHRNLAQLPRPFPPASYSESWEQRFPRRASARYSEPPV